MFALVAFYDCNYFLIIKSSFVRLGRQTGRLSETTRGFGIESVLNGDVELSLYRPPLLEIKKIVNKLNVICAINCCILKY